MKRTDAMTRLVTLLMLLAAALAGMVEFIQKAQSSTSVRCWKSPPRLYSFSSIVAEVILTGNKKNRRLNEKARYGVGGMGTVLRAWVPVELYSLATAGPPAEGRSGTGAGCGQRLAFHSVVKPPVQIAQTLSF